MKKLTHKEKAGQILKKVFGYDTFRPLQKEIIDNILEKKDTLVIMPTGGGKSLCYQLPALIFEGLTIVISPLISLMKDQVEQLKALGIPAVFLNSSLGREEYQFNVGRVIRGEIRLLYLAPETLHLDRTLGMLKALKVDCFTIDEAHCISEWGHDFRPEYRQTAQVRKQFPEAVCVALTATATPRVREDIKRNLEFRNEAEFISSFDRDNLYIQISHKGDAVTQVLNFLRKFPDQSGIIYCFSRKQVDSLAEELSALGFSVRPYHAGLPDKERRENQELFINDEIKIVVATIAFGMGINKSNVRFVIHYDLPKNLASYYQEIGRSGRDGLRANCLLLFSYSDRSKIEYLISLMENENEQRIARMHLDKMVDFCESYECRRKPLLRFFGEEYKGRNCGMCDNCRSSDKDKVDMTIPAQKFMSCMIRTGEIFGATYIIDVLRGSEQKRIVNNGHDKLSTWGIGREYNPDQWNMAVNQFMRGRLIEREDETGSLKVTPEGYLVLKGKENFTGIFSQEPVKLFQAEGSDNYDEILFALLKEKRREIAKKTGVPPYIIFSDKTLSLMAAQLPESRADMLRIHGVGAAKMDSYGNSFISVIKNYRREKISKKELPERGAYKIKKLSHRFRQTAEEFNSGKSINELVRLSGLKKSTIITHLLKALEKNMWLNADNFLKEINLPKKELKKIISVFDKLETEALTPVREALNEKYSFDQLRLVKLYLQASKRDSQQGVRYE